MGGGGAIRRWTGLCCGDEEAQRDAASSKGWSRILAREAQAPFVNARAHALKLLEY